MASGQPKPDIRTPSGAPSGLAGLFTQRTLPLLAARVGAWLAGIWGRPFRFGNLIIAARRADVGEALARDLDFLIEPVNAARFDEIGYHFILGMDRGDELGRERRALYAALAKVDMGPLRWAAAADIGRRLAAGSPGTIDAVEGYARPVAAATAVALFGIDPPNRAELMDVARAIFGHCFLNVAGDKAVAARAAAAAEILTGWFDAEIARRRASGELGQDMMGHLLRDGADDDLTRRTLGGMLVGAIDTTATVVAKVMTVLIADPVLLEAARRDYEDMPRLYGWCLEALRRWPQTPVLGRQAAADTTLAGVAAPAGSRVLLWTQAAMFDPTTFPDPDTPRPDRPVDAYLHLGGGQHPCAGRGINAWQIPMLVAGLLHCQPTGLGPLTWAGPFPAHLPVHCKGGAA